MVAAAAVAITVVAAVLRLHGLALVDGDPFYDAAVRSMGTSWHAFWLGAYDPSASTSIDKPPLDLWLQVASTKVFGFNGTALKLPEAVASTLSVPLLFVTLRRAFGDAVALAGAAVLAIFPLAVLTGRSDTMDGMMALALVGALFCLVNAARTGHARWVYGVAGCFGLAFNIKLFEALVPLPAFAVGAWLALGAIGDQRRRIAHFAGAAAALVAVSLSWLTSTLLAAHPPYAIGSTNGSAWNAALVFNGIDRIGGASGPGGGHITPPGPARLLAHAGALPAARFGLLVLAALLIGIPGLVALRRRGTPAARAAAVTIGAWAITGAVFFSAMARLHPRYTEAVTPAIAAACGAGIIWTTRRGVAGAAALFGFAAFAVWLTGAGPLAWAGLALAAVVAALVVWGRRLPGRGWAVPAAAALALCAAPAADAWHVVSTHLNDSGHPGAMPASRTTRLSAFLRSHRAGARYEFASAAATQAGTLIARDGQPVFLLSSLGGHALAGERELAKLAASGAVRYVLLGGFCAHPGSPAAVCSPGAMWTRAHGVDVSRQAGVPRGLVWQVGPAAHRSGGGSR